MAVSVSAEEQAVITRKQAQTYAMEILNLYEYSSEYAMFDGDTNGTWYALLSYLADAIYKDPYLYTELYGVWKETVDVYSGIYTVSGYDENYVSTDEEVLEITLDGSLGFIKIVEFRDGTDEKFNEAYDKALKDGMRSLIIDLRDNPGGLLEPVYEILNHIIPESLPMLTLLSKNNVELMTSDGLGDKNRRPDIRILTDNYTASAAEMFAAVLQYHGYAEVIGETTYGKGIAQNNVQLPSGSMLAVTAAISNLPDGSTWHRKGVIPDTKITDDPATKEDEVLEYAKKNIASVGHKPSEPANFYFNIVLPEDEHYISIETFASIKRMQHELNKPLYFCFISPNGMKMTVNALDVFEAAHFYNYFGIYGDQSAAAENILKQEGLPKDARIVMTVSDGDLGYTATISAEMKKEPKYFYYYDSVNEKYTEFKPSHEYEDGVIKFNIKKGGIIVLSPTKI